MLLSRFAVALNWWLPLCLGASLLGVLSAMAWLHWHRRKTAPALRLRRADRALIVAYDLAMLLWLGWGLHYLWRTFGAQDAFSLFAREEALLKAPLIMTAVAWVAALLVARLLKLSQAQR